MSIPPPAVPGMPLTDVDTPALIIDLDAFERNLTRMAQACARSGVRLRPHSKTHKSPIIALKQMAHGAVGVCCQKVSEAEAMVAGGVGDVLVSNEVWGRTKLDRLAALARQAKVGVCVDHPANVADIEAAAARAGSTIDVLVEIDVGARRCGISPGPEAVQLAKSVAASKHLRFTGLQAYQGAAQHIRAHAERKAAIDVAITQTRQTLQLLQREGLDCRIVGGAGTGTFEFEAASQLYNELQCGSYIFMDADYARNRSESDGPFDTFEHALFVHVTVMSTPTADVAVIDAGHKAFANDSGMPEPWGLAGAVYKRPSDEHGMLDLAKCNDRPRAGDKLLLVPGHCDPTVNLHDWYVGVRGMSAGDPRVEAVWPVAARGAVF